jgi:GTP-binding protein
MALAVSSEQNRRIPTPTLNELIKEATVTTPPPSDRGRRLKISYATQTAVKPPTFVLFVNDPDLLHFSYARFLENRLRDVYGFTGTSLRIVCRKKSGED